MSVKKINFMPFVGILLLAILYIAALNYRGFTAISEYEFAIALRKIFPGLSGSFLPKLPTAIATLITGGLIWLAAKKFHLAHPGTAPVLYLCFPPVWFIGTSASPAPILALLISIAAAGLFFSRKEPRTGKKIAAFAVGAVGAVGAAYFAQCGFFSWIAVILAFMPIIFLTWAVRLEKNNDQDLANKKLNRLTIFIAVLFIFMLALLLLPPICRFLRIECPGFLDIYPKSERLYRPALAFLAPLLWLYMAKEAKNYAEKIAIIGVALGFFMLTLPPSLPWNRMTGLLQEKTLLPLSNELLVNDPVIFADEATVAATAYALNREVRTVGRQGNAIHPDKLKQAVNESLQNRDVLVASSKGELEQFLPETSKMKYTLKPECNLYLFTGGKK